MTREQYDGFVLRAAGVGYKVLTPYRSDTRAFRLSGRVLVRCRRHDFNAEGFCEHCNYWKGNQQWTKENGQ